MTVSAKVFLLTLKDRKIITKIIGVLLAVIFAFAILVVCLISGTSSRASQVALIAQREYDYWQNHTPEGDRLSCIGQKYCSYYNAPIADWCCYFAGYCYKESGLEDSASGFSPTVSAWINNLERMGKLKTAASGYNPQVGNPVFFNYNGRANFAATHSAAHIGIVTEVTESTITVIAGNEYNGETSNWATVSGVNRYTVSKNNDTIACYGEIGSYTVSTGLNSVTRNVICHNEVGILYDDISSEYYGSVIANDNGAISIGVYGWHGNKALSLLQKAYQINSSQINAVAISFGNSGSYVMNSINNGATWSNYIPNSAVCSCIRAMLLTDAGKQAQDEVSLEDAQNYIDICTNNGLTDQKAIVYCCDILNQYGTASFNANVYGSGSHGVLYGVTGSMSLSDIYHSQRAWRDSRYNYESRRTWTFNYLDNMPSSALPGMQNRTQTTTN